MSTAPGPVPEPDVWGNCWGKGIWRPQLTQHSDDPPVAQTSRVAVAQLVMGEMQAGEAVTLSLLADGHDPSRHRDHTASISGWADTTRLTFGGGGYYCVGVALAQPRRSLPFRCRSNISHVYALIRGMLLSIGQCQYSMD